MTRSIFLPGARADLVEGIRYYRGQSPRVAQDFIAEVRRAARFVEENPEASPTLRRDVRKKVLLKFPYSILYAIERRQVLIVAVASHHRRPDYWHGRLG